MESQYSWLQLLNARSVFNKYALAHDVIMPEAADLVCIYMKPLDVVIHQCEVQYHQYADDIQLYISILGCLGETADVMAHCLEVVWVQMGRNKFWFDPEKTEWLWFFSPMEKGYFHN